MPLPPDPPPVLTPRWENGFFWQIKHSVCQDILSFPNNFLFIYRHYYFWNWQFEPWKVRAAFPWHQGSHENLYAFPSMRYHLLTSWRHIKEGVNSPELVLFKASQSNVELTPDRFRVDSQHMKFK